MRPLVETLYESDDVSIGTFRCRPEDPRFRGPRYAEAHLLVFPRTSCVIEQNRRKPVVADPSIVMLYNRDQTYMRDQVSPDGDRCEWFSYSDRVVQECLESINPDLLQNEDWFDRSHAPTSADDYLRQRQLVDSILGGRMSDDESLRVDEIALGLLARSLEQIDRQQPSPAERPPKPSHRDLALATQRTLAVQFSRKWTLAHLAREVHSSPYHLARVFRRCTGRSIHEHLKLLRLRTALEWIPSRDEDLAGLGLELGFSSHSHFTSTFRKTFGVTPSRWRERITKPGAISSTVLTA